MLIVLMAMGIFFADGHPNCFDNINGALPKDRSRDSKWITLLLDDSAAREDIVVLLAVSHELTKTKIRKRGNRHEQF